MKVEIDGDEIRIKGKNFGKDKHIKIYVTEKEGEDTYSFSLIRDGFESGCLPRVTVHRDTIIASNNLPQGKSIID